MEKTCSRCPQPTWSKRSPYCAEHRIEARKVLWRNTPAPHPCDYCGETIEKPYKGDQKYHDECYPKHRAEYVSTRNKAPQREPDDQMDRLFAKYESRQSIKIDDREDGSRLLIISDLQLPFVDQALYKAVLQFAGDWRPHDIVWNGDILDAYEISSFDTNPTRRFGIAEEIKMARDALYDFSKRLAVGGRQRFIDGNHEERLRRYIWRNAGELAEIIPDLDQLLDLDNVCAGSVPYGKHIDFLGFVITHGNYVSAHSAYTAKRHADRYHSSGVNGHTHRLGSYSYTDGKSVSHTWYEMGCLCRTDLEYVRGTANWQQGFLVGHVRGGALYPQLVHVIEHGDGSRGFMVDGQHYEI